MEGFVVDRANLIVFARVTGFLDEAMVAKMITESRRAARVLGKDFGRHSLLYDLTSAQVASVASIDTICRMVADPADRSLWAHRVAFYTPSVLIQMQMQRVCNMRPGIAIFAERRSAIAWIHAERGRIAA